MRLLLMTLNNLTRILLYQQKIQTKLNLKQINVDCWAYSIKSASSLSIKYLRIPAIPSGYRSEGGHVRAGQLSKYRSSR